LITLPQSHENAIAMRVDERWYQSLKDVIQVTRNEVPAPL